MQVSLFSNFHSDMSPKLWLPPTQIKLLYQIISSPLVPYWVTEMTVWQKQTVHTVSVLGVVIVKLPETTWAESDRGGGVRSFFIRHTLRTPEMFEQEVEIILCGLEGQLVQ